MEQAGMKEGVAIAVSAGELIDRITILQIKSERIQDPDKLGNVHKELSGLLQVRRRQMNSDDSILLLEGRLRNINENLWDIEDAIRRCERIQDFGNRFVQLARSVYLRNDQRASVKREINDLLGSRIVEEKEYDQYASLETTSDADAPAATVH